MTDAIQSEYLRKLRVLGTDTGIKDRARRLLASLEFSIRAGDAEIGRNIARIEAALKAERKL